jgi:hypothetical protein
MQALGPPRASIAHDINDATQVVGVVETADA